MTRPSSIREWTNSAIQLGLVVLAVTAAKCAIAEPYYVPSGSMEPTLLIGDQLLATKYPYGYSSASLPISLVLPVTPRVLGATPERGDVVVFRSPANRSQVWVKRVIGLPGDRIALREGRVWINGRAVALRPDGIGQIQLDSGATIPAPRFIETLPGGREHPIFKTVADDRLDDMAEVIVSPDHLFVMGDNRDHSADSRIPADEGGVGLLPIGNLIGRADALVGSWDIAARNEPVWRWPSGLRWSRFFTAVH